MTIFQMHCSNGKPSQALKAISNVAVVFIFIFSFACSFHLERTVNSSVVYVLNATDDIECNTDIAPDPDIDSSSIFHTLNFNASWISNKYFWNSTEFDFESRAISHFRKVKRDDKIVRVIVLPHSHNDPGWLNTYEQYYQSQTMLILQNAVKYLTEFPEMTFVWSETTYLAKWWKESATSFEKEQLMTLVHEGRLELATGGWVVPDEATSSLYSLALQLVEGQQWIKNNLFVTPKYSWAIDPFGHSSTHSNLLKMSNMQGMVIQRLHYVWKHWFAQRKTEEFKWRPRWDSSGKFDISCLTLPYDLYSIKHACGPQVDVCLKFDFRSIPYEYGENFGLMTPITKTNVRKLSQELASQYYKTASLTKHNVILVPLGDDFRFDRPLEWEQQYANYMQIFSFINSNPDRFKMEIGFGTLRQYFEIVDQEYKKRSREQPTLSGDFFPYGDVYVSGKPAYWTGFYSTRPYWKRLHREVEHELRSAEILFTYANAFAKQSGSLVDSKILSYKYQDVITSRHDFAIFTHHDGITGTSRKWTMEDYGERLHNALQNCIAIQIQSLKIIYKHVLNRDALPQSISKGFIRDKFEVLSEKIPLEVFGLEDEYVTKVTIFNSLAWSRTEMIKIRVKQGIVKVLNSAGSTIPSQINPVFYREDSTATIRISYRVFELVFLANLEPLSFTTFKIYSAILNQDQMGRTTDDNEGYSTLAVISCKSCSNLENSLFPKQNTSQEIEDALTIENSLNKLYFNKDTGLLENVELKKENISAPVKLSFGFYRPVNRESGAYLLKPLLGSEWQYFRIEDTNPLGTITIKGPVMSQIIATHFSRHLTMLVNTTLIHGRNVGDGIRIENFVDITRDYSNRVEAFMRLDTNIKSSDRVNHTEVEPEVPIMYTDQNGLVSEKRINIPEINYEGNTYPVTTMAYIQDEQSLEKIRLSVLVDRTHGFCSMNPGRLETLIERKSVYDDGRGLSQAVSDSKATVSSYVILLEALQSKNQVEENGTSEKEFSSWQPTLAAHHASLKLNYPPNVFIYNGANDDNSDVDQTISLISAPLENNVHLFNLRTLSQSTMNGHDDEREGDEGLLNLQYLSEYKAIPSKRCNSSKILTVDRPKFHANFVNISGIEGTALTGVGQGLNRDTNNGLESSKPLLSSYKLHF